MTARKSKPKKKPVSPLDRARQIIAAWPETEERLSHGAPTWWGGKKTFATFHDNHHGDGRVALWIKSDVDTQEDLTRASPDLFYIPPYVGHRGWIGAVVAQPTRGRVDWKLIEELLEIGYRSVAPKKALALLDQAQGG